MNRKVLRSKKKVSKVKIVLICVTDYEAVIAFYRLPSSTIHSARPLPSSRTSDVLFYLMESPKLSFLKDLSPQYPACFQ